MFYKSLIHLSKRLPITTTEVAFKPLYGRSNGVMLVRKKSKNPTASKFSALAFAAMRPL